MVVVFVDVVDDVVDDVGDGIQTPPWQAPPKQLVPSANAVPAIHIVLTQILGLWHVMFWQTEYCGLPAQRAVVVVVVVGAEDVAADVALEAVVV